MKFVYLVLAVLLAVQPLVAQDGGANVAAGVYGQAGGRIQKVSRPAVKRSVQVFLKKYPQATLQDVYKNNFQDYFGPSHIMSDKEGVLRYLNWELAQMEKEGKEGKIYREENYGKGNYYDPCGWRHNYYQVSLLVIKEGMMTVGEFADAFMAGGGAAPQVTAEWIQEWEVIKRAVKRVAPDLEGLEEDASRIDALLKGGDYVVHHSKKYEETYFPHYRIIRGDVFENVVLPKILVGK